MVVIGSRQPRPPPGRRLAPEAHESASTPTAMRVPAKKIPALCTQELFMVTITPGLAQATMPARLHLAAAAPPAAHSAAGPAGLLLLLVLAATVFLLSA